MSEFQRFQAEQERLQAKISAAIAAQRRRDCKPSFAVTGWDLLKAFLYIAGFGSLFAILFVRWLSGWHL